jgi:hypothetical protein
MGDTSASAQLVSGSTEFKRAAVRPPVLSEVRVVCRDWGGDVAAKLRNPNATEQSYMVGISAGDIYHDYAVTLAAKAAEVVEFGGFPDGTYLLQVQNADGDYVAQARVAVQCDDKPPTGTPTGTPTASPTASPTRKPTVSPSKTPTTQPTTGTSSATTAVPSTPVAVPTAVEAGLPGSVAQVESDHGGSIVGVGLLVAAGIMIGLRLLLVRRRRGLHQL